MEYKRWCQTCKYISKAFVLAIALNLILSVDGKVQSPEAATDYITLYSHIGNTHPLLQKWVSPTVYPEEGIKIGPTHEKGIPAWVVDDNSSMARFTYFVTPSADEVKQAWERGWRLRVRLRVVDFPDPAPNIHAGEDASPFVLYRDGSRSFQLHFLTTADKQLSLYLAKDISARNRHGVIIKISDGISRYHQLELVHAPRGQRISVYIDGQLRYYTYTGARFTSLPILMWGAGSTTATGHANFNLLSFEVGVSANGESDVTELNLMPSLNPSAYHIPSRS